MLTNPLTAARHCAHTLALTIVLTAISGLAGVAAATLELMADPSVVNHYPGPDGLMGNTDDLVSAATTLSTSDPNVPGAFSYNAFDFSGAGAITDPGLPAGTSAVTFLAGSVTVDTAVAAAGGGALLTGLAVSGTQPFNGHGPYSAAITGVNGGSYDPVSGAFTLDVDFTASLVGGTANALNFALSGTAWYIDAADFGTATGNAYLDHVLLPLAQSAGAGALLFAQASGVVPASSGGSGGFFPSMPIEAVIVATAPVPVPPAAWLLGSALFGFAMRPRRRN